MKKQWLLRSFLKLSLTIIFINSLTNLQAHTYYQGITDIRLNTAEQRIEIVHHFTTHDFEVLLSDQLNQRVSADQKENYAKQVKQYIQEKFSLLQNTTEAKPTNKIDIQWIGVENGINETVIYQTIPALTSLQGITIRNKILIDFFPQQVNRVNYHVGQLSGTLIFQKNHTHDLFTGK